MTRLNWLLMGCLLLVGCSANSSDAPEQKQQPSSTNSNDPSTAAPRPAGGTSASQAVYDCLAGTYRGSEVEILALHEQPVTTPKTVGTAVQVEWRLKGTEERHNDILLIQSDRVVFQMSCQPGKGLDVNVAAAVKQFEN